MKKSNPWILGVALQVAALSPSLVNLPAVVAQENAPSQPKAPDNGVPTSAPLPNAPVVSQPSSGVSAGQAVPPETVAPAGESPTGTAGEDANMMAVTSAYNSGLAALKRDDFAAAGDYFNSVVQMAPNDVNALLFLGYVRFKQDRFDEALISLEAAKKLEIQLAPKARAALYNNLGLAYWNRKQNDLAIASYQKALELDKNSPDARYNLASSLLSSKRWKEAIPQFQALLVKDANDATLHDGVGLAYEKIGNWPKALAAYRKAMTLNPKEASYPLNLALALEKTGRQTEAVQYLREAVKLDPQNASALLHLGDIFIARARWPEAQEVLARYVSVRPDDFVGWYNLGVSYDYNAKFDSALQAYGRAEAINPNDAAVKNNIGRIYYKRGKLDEGVEMLQRALERDPNNMDARYNLGLVLAAQNKWQEANVEWRKVLGMAGDELARVNSEPKPAVDKKRSLQSLLQVARGAIAENYLKAKQFSEAAGEYKILLAGTPNNLAAMTNRGFALYHIKEYGEAEKVYRALIKRDAKNAYAYNNLGAVLEAQNKRSEALEMYRKALQLKPDYSEAKSNIDRLMAATAVG